MTIPCLFEKEPPLSPTAVNNLETWGGRGDRLAECGHAGVYACPLIAG